MLMVCDVETSDLPRKDLPRGDPGQPWITSAAAMLCQPDGTVVDHFHCRVRSDGRSVRPGAEAVHGISTRSAGRNGVSETTVLGLIAGFADQATHIIGHGIAFDRGIIEDNLVRLNKSTRLFTRTGITFVCTMLASVPVCRLPNPNDFGTGGFKWPTLDEACQIILGMAPREGFHSAWDDVDRARRLFLELRNRGIVEAQ